MFRVETLRLHDRFTSLIASYLDGAVADGAIPPLDTRVAGAAWFGAIHELVVRWLVTDRPAPLEDAFPTLCGCCCCAASASPRRASPPSRQETCHDDGRGHADRAVRRWRRSRSALARRLRGGVQDAIRPGTPVLVSVAVPIEATRSAGLVRGGACRRRGRRALAPAGHRPTRSWASARRTSIILVGPGPVPGGRGPLGPLLLDRPGRGWSGRRAAGRGSDPPRWRHLRRARLHATPAGGASSTADWTCRRCCSAASDGAGVLTASVVIDDAAGWSLGRRRRSLERVDRVVGAASAAAITAMDHAMPSLREVGGRPDRAEWSSSVARSAGAVGRGRIDKVVLARRVDIETSAPIDVTAVLARLGAPAADRRRHGSP